MNCTTCGISAAPHELIRDKCHRCTANELANARVFAESLQSGLNAAEGELERIKAILPDTYYADRELSARVAMLVEHWRKLVVIAQWFP